MFAERSCRACGCVEWRACPDGCAWIAADRCSACPDAPLTLPIRAAHVVASPLQPVNAYRWKSPDGDEMRRLIYRAADYPNLIVMATIRGDVVVNRTVYVGAMEVAADDVNAMAELLNEATVRRAA